MANYIPVGYTALIERFNLSVLEHYRKSFIAPKGRGSVHIENNREIHIYQKTYALKDPENIFEQLEFAIKHDGINLEILQAIFNKISDDDVVCYINNNKSGKYMRIVWFLYEFLTDREVCAPGLGRLKYVDILDRDRYFTANGIKSTRHKVINNLIGTKDFCPLVRKTKKIEKHIANKYDDKATKVASKYDPQLIARASHYLFTKETLSSYEIEREKPSKERMTRFINIIQKTSKINKLDKKLLIQLQNIIVDPRFVDANYRDNQNYVGENVYTDQLIHYISPKPNNVETLMNGLLDILHYVEDSDINAVIIAAFISFGFLFIHPFEDGNGRIHRVLIHYILSKKKFTPDGVIFPVSAVMLKKIHQYDAVLEFFSKPLMKLITDYTLSDDGVLVVNQETQSYYKYIDYTVYAEYLFDCIDDTLKEHFELEIEFLIKYDKAKSQIQSVVDMPDRLIDLFIKFVTQNHGKLGKQKRTSYFDKLSDDEVRVLQDIVKQTML